MATAAARVQAAARHTYLNGDLPDIPSGSAVAPLPNSSDLTNQFVEVTVTSATSEVQLQARVQTNGTDFYYLNTHGGAMRIKLQNAGADHILAGPTAIDASTYPYTLVLRAVGSELRAVFANGSTSAVLNATDSTFSSGGVFAGVLDGTGTYSRLRFGMP